MDTHSNIRDLREHRDDTGSFAHDHLTRSETRPSAAKAAVASVEFGSGWYHEAAIEVAGRAAVEARCHPVHW